MLNNNPARLVTALLFSSTFLVAGPRPDLDVNKLPLSFEPNRGQGDASSQYFARGAGYTIGLRPTGVVISVREKGAKQQVVTLRLQRASGSARAVAEEPLPGKVNYFLGSNPVKWRTNIATFAAVRYVQVYAGIDAVYHGKQGRLEYDFRVRPGANPAVIRLKVDGAMPIIDARGDVVLGTMRQTKPVAYQGEGSGRRKVACEYALTQTGDLRFELGPYDHRQELVIDPVLSYATYAGGSNGDAVTGVKVDASGNLYIAGTTASANFTTRGGFKGAYGGSNSQLLQMQFGDAFVAKLNAAGTAFVYSTYLGGSGDDLATALAIDASGNAYVVGGTQSADFPTTAGVVQKTYQGFTADANNGFYNSGDGFLTKLNPNGNGLVYSTYLGGSLNDLALGVAVDSNGNAAVVGGTESSNFPTTPGALSTQYRGNLAGTDVAAGDAFVTVVNPSGTGLVFSTYLGGNGTEAARGVGVDSQNNIYVTGFTSSANFPTSTGAYQTTFQNSGGKLGFNPIVHGFVTKFSPQGALVYSTLLGGESSDQAAALAVDASGAVYVTGATNSTKFPTTSGAAQSTYAGRGAAGDFGESSYGDAFVTKLNATGTAVVYSTYLGGSGDDAGLGIAVDSAGNAYVTGGTISSNFPVTGDALQKTFGGFGGQGMAPNNDQGFPTERVRNTGDAFLTKVSPTGALSYSSYYGGSKDDVGLAIAVDSAGNAYVGGNTVSPDLTTSGASQTAFGGAGTQFPRGDGFLAKVSFGGTLPGPAAKVSVTGSFVGTGTTQTTLPTPFTVQVTDAQANPVPGVIVTFTASGATVNPASATTDAQGKASTQVTLGSTAGSGTVTATVPGLTPATSSLTINPGVTAPVVKAVVNGASFLPPISGGSWISVFIDQTVPAAVVASKTPFPALLGSTRVLVNSAPIPLYAITPLSPSGTQINAQLPYEIGAGNAQLVVELNGVASAAYPIAVQATGPGIFVFGNNRAVVQNVAPDGTLPVNTADNPVPAGDYIIVYLTGQGPVNPAVPTNALAGSNPLSVPTQPYSATLNGNTLQVAFLGMTPGQISLAQANIQIPRDTKPGTYPLVITVGSAQSNGPVISVTNPRQ